AIFVIYYSLFSLGWTFGETKALSPATAIWIPIVVTTLVAAWLMLGLNKTSPLDPKDTLRRIVDLVGRIFREAKSGSLGSSK
ncbi:MAG: LptF/LptG family permease, partial [Deltaproteobacteria bacterium]|nr:LptF/LptG family permease [Deltaproteobacteria bacterium]